MRYERADLIVVGGGLVGSLAARAAVARGLTVRVIDEGRPRLLEPVTYHCAYDEADLVRWLEPSLSVWQEFDSARYPLDLQAFERLEVGPELGGLRAALELGGEAHRVLDSEEANRTYRYLRLPEGWTAIRMVRAGRLNSPQLLAHLWENLAGVHSDTQVRFIDFEHESPTAVSYEVAFRGRYLLVAAGQATAGLLGLDLPGGVERRAVFFGGGEPLYGGARLEKNWEFEPGDQGFELVGPDQEMPEELRRLAPSLFAHRLGQRQTQEQERPYLGELDFRSDIGGYTALGAGHRGLAPQLAEVAIERLLGERGVPAALAYGRSE
ncbi:MAG: FAD-dependent oxidoreductase [Vulcanimicrobiota bacterium]